MVEQAALLLATNNGHKLDELRGMLRPHGLRVVSPSDIGISLDVAETGDTFASNATLKAEAFARASDMLSLADDSGLVVDALGGAPGVHSARYGGPGLNDHDRNALLLERLRGVPAPERTARFVSIVALAEPGWPTQLFEGRVEGVITAEPRGEHGFGYDPIFLVPELNRTLAELTIHEKASVSHRGRAMARALDYLLGKGRGAQIKTSGSG